MPSIQMKTKLSMSCLKEKKDIGVCRRSTLISKNHLRHNGVSKTVEDIYTCAQNNKDALVSGKVHFEDIENKWTNNDELSGEKLFEKQPSALSNSHTDSLEEPLSSTFPSNTDTFFSPILESIDFYSNEGIDSLFVPRLHVEDSEESSRSSCEIQACNVSDFYISDIIFSGSPIGCPSELENKIETSFLSDYKCEESSLVCDLKEDFLILPFLEDAVDAECDHSRPSEVTITGADNSSFYMAIHQLQSDNHDSYITTYSDQDYEGFDPQMYIRSLPYQPEITCTLLPRTVPNEQLSVKRITLVLDLDETLVHSTLDPCRDADFTFTVLFNMKEHVVYVKQRPHLQTFLKRVAEMFDVVVFTASQSIYAEQILDILDPDGMVISRRAYRESCIFSDGTYMKDLTVLGVDLAKVAIIDNSPQVFRLQVNNGIPIKSWFSDSSDSALISLLPFLETLADADDVRPIIARKFGNKE